MEFSTLKLTISAVILTVGLYLYTIGSTFIRTVYLSFKIPRPSLWDMATVHTKGLLGDNLAEHFWKTCANYRHKPWGVWTHLGYLVMVSDSESVSQVYKNQHLTNRADLIVKDLSKYIGKGLLTLNGEEHRVHRKLFSPMFRRSFLESQLPRINVEAAKIVQRIHEKGEGSVDVRHLVDIQLAAIMVRTFTSVVVPFEKYQPLVKCISDFAYDVHLRFMNPFYYWLVYRMTNTGRQNRADSHWGLKEVRKNIIHDRNFGMAKRSQNYNQATSSYDVMLDVSEKMEEDSAIDGTLNIFAAGQHTTAFTINIILVLLAIHPYVQDKVFQEIQDTIQLVDPRVAPEDLAKMVYLEMVLKETLRLFPAVPVVARRADEETRVGDVLIPKGASILTHLMAINRDPKFFKDPLRFDPERFSPESSQGRHPFAYVPFGGGNRVCPGQLATMLIVKTVLCQIVSNFKILPGNGFRNVDDISVSMYFTLRLNKSSLRFVPRDRPASL